MDVTEFQTNLVPDPRIHFMLCSTRVFFQDVGKYSCEEGYT